MKRALARIEDHHDGAHPLRYVICEGPESDVAFCVPAGEIRRARQMLRFGTGRVDVQYEPADQFARMVTTVTP